MIRTHCIAAIAALSVLACSDSTAPIRRLSGGGGPPETALEISGRVSVTGNGYDYAVDLTTSDGTVIRLIGNQTAYLASVDGANVVVRGAWEVAQLPPDTSLSGPDRSIVSDLGLPARTWQSRFIAYDFAVIAVEDRLALDGVLELNTDGYALRLANGEVRLVTGCPESIGQFVGMRLWVVGSEDEPPFAFGVITAI